MDDDGLFALEIFPTELWKEIYSYLSSEEDRNNFGFTCSDFLKIHVEGEVTIYPGVPKDLLWFFTRARSLIIKDENLSAEQLKYFSDVPELDLSNLAHLEEENILDLRNKSLKLYGDVASDESLKFLTNLETLDLRDSPLAGNTLSGLTGLTSLSLTGCENFEDGSLAGLTNLRELKLSFCKNVTPNSINKLVGLRRLEVTCCGQISHLPSGVDGKIIKSLPLYFVNRDVMPSASMVPDDFFSWGGVVDDAHWDRYAPPEVSFVHFDGEEFSFTETIGRTRP